MRSVLLALLCVLVARLAFATTIVLEGTNAAQYYGEPGESVRAVADGDDPANSATATGGNGGSTGFTNITGGTGGTAEAIAQTILDGAAQAVSRATGGFGGGTDFDPFLFTEISGRGGPGGSANASAISESRTDSDASSSARADGGKGGSITAGPRAGAGGAATATSSGTSAGGDVESIAFSSGGYGGDIYPSDIPQRGGIAGVGGSAITSARGELTASGGSLEVTGSARGGSGGEVFGDAGGTGGAGGAANSTSIGIASGEGRVEVRDQATGGWGGSMPSSVYDWDDLGELGIDIGGNGGNGGNAVSRAEGRNAGASPVLVFAEAVGGTGGSGVVETGMPLHFGGLPGSASASAYGESPSGEVTVTARQQGGHGGAGADGAQGRDGASSQMIDSVSGSTSGTLHLIQRSEGGIGGWAWQSTGGAAGTAGAGGAATASLSAANPGGGPLDLLVEAFGGYGGEGGRGIGGNGGAASLGTIAGTSGTGQEVRVSARAVGGHGGDARFSGGTGGTGASVVLENHVTGSTSGALYLSQTAQGGGGGVVEQGGQAGSPGDATSILVHENASQLLAVDLRSIGGAGAFTGYTGGDATRGGTASTDGRVTNTSGNLILNASAQGGSGGSISANPSLPAPRVGDGANAVVHAEATTTGNGQSVSIGSSAVGGAGGSGGRVTGGRGGDATSASVGSALGDSEVSVWDRARGGDGGNSEGGAGGSASSSASALNAGSSSVSAIAEATGGTGGYGAQPGAGGTAAATATASSTGGGAATAIVRVTGGAGGLGGPSAPILVRDAVTGSTSGLLTLEQHVLGGGPAYNLGGNGGEAQSSLFARNDGGGDLDVLLDIVGGSGTRNQGGNGGNGARAIFDQLDAAAVPGRDLRAALRMQGGAGGTVEYGSGRGGDGASVQFDTATDDFRAEGADGVALSFELKGGAAGSGLNGDAGNAGSAQITVNREVSAESVRVQASSLAGNGGNSDGAGVSASAGADARTAAAIVNPAGLATLLARAQGGRGGGGVNGATGARGGDAFNSASASSDGDGSDVVVGDERIGTGARLDSTSGAFGGDASYGTGGQGGSDGGDASSASSGQANGESDVRVFDLAIGGKGGAPASFDSGPAGDGGSATSSAVGRTHGAGDVEVVAIAVGGEGGFKYGGGSGDGGSASLGDVLGLSDTGAVRVRGEARAGVTREDGTNPDVVLDNAVRGSTAGLLQLAQGAFASGAGRGSSRLQGVVDTQSAIYRAESSGSGSRAEVDVWNRLGSAQASVKSRGTTLELATGLVRARTSLDGSDVAIGSAIDVWKASQADYGVFGGLDGASESFGIADGRANVSVHDLAVGASGGLLYYGEPTREGGAATSFASGVGGGSEVLASSIAIGGQPEFAYLPTPTSGSLVGGSASARSDARAEGSGRAESRALVATSGASARSLSTATGTDAMALAAAGTNQALMTMSVAASGTAVALARLNSTGGELLGSHQAGLDVLSILDSRPDVPQGALAIPVGSAALQSLTANTATFSFALRMSVGSMDANDRDLFLALEAPDFLDGVRWMDLRLESEAGTLFEEHLEGGAAIADLFDEPVRLGRLPQRPLPQYPPVPIPEVLVSLTWMIESADGGSFDPTVTFLASVAPEPASIALLGLLALVLIGLRSRWTPPGLPASNGRRML